jgi:DNA-binding response OmpR family regulator
MTPSGYETALKFHPHLALLDVAMPKKSGHDLARELRAIKGVQSLVLVATTGFGTDDDRRRSKEAGFDEHLVKPIELDKLDDILTRTGS